MRVGVTGQTGQDFGWSSRYPSQTLSIDRLLFWALIREMCEPELRQKRGPVTSSPPKVPVKWGQWESCLYLFIILFMYSKTETPKKPTSLEYNSPALSSLWPLKKKRSEDASFTGLASIWSKYIHKFQRDEDLFITLSIVYFQISIKKHLFAGICEYVTLCQG